MVSRQGTLTRHPRFPLSPTTPPPSRPISTQIFGAIPAANSLRTPPLVPIPKVPRPVTSSSHPPLPQSTLPLATAAIKPQERNSEPPSPLAVPSPHEVKYYKSDYFPSKMGLETINPKTDTRKQLETFKKQQDIGILSTTEITCEYKGVVMSAFVNSNVQGVNNSILYNSSVTHRHPGVHLSLS